MFISKWWPCPYQMKLFNIYLKWHLLTTRVYCLFHHIFQAISFIDDINNALIVWTLLSWYSHLSTTIFSFVCINKWHICIEQLPGHCEWIRMEKCAVRFGMKWMVRYDTIKRAIKIGHLYDICLYRLSHIDNKYQTTHRVGRNCHLYQASFV